MQDTARKSKVFIVDDQIINIQVLSEMLKEDYDVMFATNGNDALELICKIIPDIILLDVMIPDMSGYEICKIIKADPLLNDIPVFFITAMNAATDEIVGLKLGAADYITKPFNPDIVKLRVRNHLKLKKLMDLQKKMAFIDGLTGVANHRAFDEYINREWLRAQRDSSKLSLAMIDIDHFKKFNDSYGHLAGDDCLKAIAQTLAAALMRPTDFLARYGGEEFICVLPETDIEGALKIGEKLCSSIESLQMKHSAEASHPFVTISIGIASSSPNNESDSGTLIKTADQQLYKAKAEGRNRVAHIPA